MNSLFKKHTLPAILLLTTTLFFSGCRKEKDQVPNVYVDLYLYTSDPAFSPLNATSGYTYLSGGSRGIIVFRKSTNEFMAYDRHCTFNVSENNQVAVNASGLIAEDAVCGSKFLITDGTPNSGPASVPLKYYQTSFDGTVLHIYN